VTKCFILLESTVAKLRMFPSSAQFTYSYMQIHFKHTFFPFHNKNKEIRLKYTLNSTLVKQTNLQNQKRKKCIYYIY